MPNPRIILLSGMGADARVFAKQIEAIPEIEVPEWIEPFPNESLKDYARRFAEQLQPNEPYIIGGASFGGFVAMEMIRHLNPLACFLIGSVRSPNELPDKFKAMKAFSSTTRFLPVELATLLSKMALLSSGSDSGNHTTTLLTQISDANAAFLRWACQAVLQWSGNVETGDTPIYQIHGEKDFVLPAKNTPANVVVPDAGHALSMTHPDEVIRFLKTNRGH